MGLQGKGVECLSIFLQPTSIDEYKTRLEQMLTETDEEIQARMEAAEAQINNVSR